MKKEKKEKKPLHPNLLRILREQSRNRRRFDSPNELVDIINTYIYERGVVKKDLGDKCLIMDKPISLKGLAIECGVDEDTIHNYGKVEYCKKLGFNDADAQRFSDLIQYVREFSLNDIREKCLVGFYSSGFGQFILTNENGYVSSKERKTIESNSKTIIIDKTTNKKINEHINDVINNE